jgi:molecular chaperone HscB
MGLNRLLWQIYQDDIVQFAFDKCALKRLNLLQNQLLARITRNSFASFNMEKLDCKRLATAYLLELQGINAFDEKDTQMDVDFLMNQIELRESLEVIKTTKDEMALEDNSK